MDIANCVHRFHLHNDRILYKNVQSITYVELNAIVYKRHRYLRSDRESTLLQFINETGFISTLEQSRAQS